MNKLLFFLTLLTIGFNVQAVTLKSLYEVTVLVESQSSSSRDLAIEQSFADLLVRITGIPGVTERDTVSDLLRDSKRYIRSFRYQQVKPVSSEKIVTLWQQQSDETESTSGLELDDTESPKQALVVSFDEKAVNDALWKKRLPVWGKTRPSTLLWLAFEDSAKRLIVSTNQPSEFQEYISERSQKRGLPVILPKMDEEDRKNVNVSDVWGGYTAPLKFAISKYKAEAIASARLKLNKDNTWESQWSLIQGEDVEQWRVEGGDAEQVVQQGIDDLAERISQRYVHVADVAEGETVIYVSDVNTVFDYNRVSKYLSGLAGVNKADLIEVKANQIAFKLDLRSSPKALKQSIALGKTLAFNDAFVAESQESVLSYRLQP